MTDTKNVPTLVAQFSMFAVRFHTDIQYSWAWAEYLPTGLQYHFETAKCRATQVIDAYRFYRLKPQVDMYQSIKECEASNMGWSVLDIEDRLHVACLPDAGDSYEL
jgi:hypothetical protein